MYKWKHEYNDFNPNSKSELLELKNMTLLTGPAGTGKSTVMKHEVDIASHLRPTLYFSFKNRKFADANFKKAINQIEVRDLLGIY